MTNDAVEGQIAQWRTFVQHRRALQGTDADELEDHLRSTIAELGDAGLQPDEAFLVAVKRMGSLDDLAREFAREHSDRLWKQLVLAGDDGGPADGGGRRAWWPMLVCAILGIAAVKVPAAFGVPRLFDPFYAHYLGLFALAPLAAYFLWQRAAGRVTITAVTLLFALGAAAATVFRDRANDLTPVHLPVALWFAVGLAYAAGDWRSAPRRMDFVRFTGEAFIYFVLIALGGGVLTGITAATFNAIGLDATPFIQGWLLPCGIVGAVVVAGWLVEAKQSVVENMAPVLTRLFTPLFTAVLIAFMVAIALSGHRLGTDRDLLILFNLVLVVVVGLVLYSISARDPRARPGLFDRLQLALVASALVIDVLVLIAVHSRTGDSYGYTANRVAALGLNLVLFAGLAWSALLLGRFVAGRGPFHSLERWQTDYLPAYAGWVWIVALVFPLIFGYA